MNVSDIAVKNTFVSGRKTAFGADSFLSIGKKGQTVEGIISNVSDRISINFNGIEVMVSGSAVQNATEGEVRKFKIMDVSKENIVLKEVGNNTVSGSTRAMMGTTVSASSYSFSDYLAGSQSISEAKKQAGENLTVLTGEDYQGIESEQGALEEYKESALDRAIERAKEKSQWQQERMENYHQSQQETQENIETMQEQGILSQISQEQIAKALQGADLPVSDVSIARVSTALQMAQVVADLSDNARAYVVENQLTPTIENLYHGQYSGSGGRSSDIVDDETWQQILPQVKEVLSNIGIDQDYGLQQAKWLFANDLPITVQSMEVLQTLDKIQESVTAGQALDQILQAMSAGSAPEQASLDTSQFVIAKRLVQDFYRVTEQDVISAAQAAESSDDITLAALKQAAEGQGMASSGDQPGAESMAAMQLAASEEANAVAAQTVDAAGSAFAQGQNDGRRVRVVYISRTERMALAAQRQLEEIRLKMTLQAAMRMTSKGIDIEVTPLKELVENLRQMENDFYKGIFTRGTEEITDGQTSLLQEALRKTEDIKNAPAALIGSSVKQHDLLTVNELHGAAVSATVRMRQYQSDYEAVGTQVRTDLGDSIQKAFGNVPDLLQELGMEDTQANERAVRILGYNQMEITKENISLVKEQDARVNSIIDNMKPSVALEMIRKGENPLEIPLSELDERLREIAGEKNVGDEEKYSRYLWKLEQDGSISEQEREGYIGIYRLLNQINKTDGAAVGAVLDAHKDMTLGNLLTAVRTMRGKGVDAQIDDTFGALNDLRYVSHSITEQIETGFSGNLSGQDNNRGDGQPSASGQQDTVPGAAQGQAYGSQAEYYNRLTEQALDLVTPSALQQISDGDMDRLLHTSVEMFKEQLEDAKGNPELEHAMYEQLASELRETAAQDEKAVQFLDRMGIPDTMANVFAAEHILEQGYDVQKELFHRRQVLDETEKQEYEGLLETLPDGLESEEAMAGQCARLEGFMEKILDRSYEQKQISYSDLKDLKLLGQGMLLEKQLVRRQSYEIPIETGDTITSMNVTLVQGTQDSGKVQISLQAPSDESEDDGGLSEYGNISIELRVSRNDIRGLVLCDNRNGYEKLSNGKEQLTAGLEQKDFVVKNLSYGMDYKAREDMAAGEQAKQAPTTRLYQAAKVVVQHTIHMLKDSV